MKPVVTALIAATLFAFAASLPTPANAVPPGYVAVKDPNPPRGPWEARVRWVQPHWDPNHTMYYTYTYMTISGPSQQSCQQQLQAVTASPGVSVVQFCQPV